MIERVRPEIEAMGEAMLTVKLAGQNFLVRWEVEGRRGGQFRSWPRCPVHLCRLSRPELPARPVTRLICSADRAVDLAHANQLKDMDNVEVIVMPNGYEHVQTMTMWRNGKLGAQLDWLLA